MGDEQEVGTGRRPRRWRTVSEKRRIAELTFERCASVLLVARAHGVNANQVFKWRRALKRGELNEPVAASMSLLPVTCQLLALRPILQTRLMRRNRRQQAARPQNSYLRLRRVVC
jgi:transposase